jgi:hypothetical protein
VKKLLIFFSGTALGLLSENICTYSSQESLTNQIIISEIMADPNPCVGLPDAEYIELFNRGEAPVQMEGWSMAFGKNEKILPSVTLDPGEFLIICESGKEDEFLPFGRVVAVQKMPAIVNTGQTLTLKSGTGAIIHTVTFSPDWCNSTQKSQGGWSLEMIDPDNPCGYSQNWSESVDIRGGTPGSENSVKASNPDVLPPCLLRAVLPSDSSVLLIFSERMDSASMNSPWLYSASDDLLHPSVADPVGPDYTAILLSYSLPFEYSQSYTLTVLNSLKDCAGNSLCNNAITSFAIPETPSFFDIVINEVLPEPHPGNSEFIEFYNRSTKVMDLSDFSIGLADAETQQLTYTFSLKNHPFLLFPGGYLVITRQANKLPSSCFLNFPQAIVEQNNLFSLPNEEGIIMLMDTLSGIIDQFHYSSSMHAQLLTNPIGVSLERTDPEQPTNDPENWHSASATSGYCTPGEQNSQMVIPDLLPEEIIVQPEVFSPDDDGIDDYASLHIRLHEPGSIASVMIFDIHGNKIRDLTSNSLLGTDENLIWDGTSNDLRQAAMGIYIFYIEIFNQRGIVKKIKKVVTLTKRL